MKKVITLPITLTVIIVAVFLFELVIPGNLSWLGIRPRSFSGLVGIVLSPFLHRDLGHILANIFPLLIMGCLVSALAPSLFVLRTVVLILLSGSFTWLLSSSDIVIGASGLAFAYWAFLITNGVLQKKFKDIVVAIVTFVIYGTLVFALFSLQEGVSWAGHFSGVIAGVIFAFIQRRQ